MIEARLSDIWYKSYSSCFEAQNKPMQGKITRGVHLPYFLWYHQFGSMTIISSEITPCDWLLVNDVTAKQNDDFIGE